MGVSSSTFTVWIGGSSGVRPAAPWAREGSAASPRGTSVRAQTAIVRALADALRYHAARGEAAISLREQLVEELARLGLRPSRNVTGDR